MIWDVAGPLDGPYERTISPRRSLFTRITTQTFKTCSPGVPKSRRYVASTYTGHIGGCAHRALSEKESIPGNDLVVEGMSAARIRGRLTPQSHICTRPISFTHDDVQESRIPTSRTQPQRGGYRVDRWHWTAGEAARLPNKTHAIPGDDVYYIAELDVLHSLHCLVRVGLLRH